MAIDDDVVNLIKAVADEGYTIVLDVFTLKTGVERLLPLADIVKRTPTCLTRCCRTMATVARDRIRLSLTNRPSGRTSTGTI